MFGNSPLVRQSYVYGNSAHPYLLAVVVPTEEALAYNDVERLKPLDRRLAADRGEGGGPAVL